MVEAQLPRERPRGEDELTQKPVPAGVKITFTDEFIEELTEAMENSPLELIVDLGEEESEEEAMAEEMDMEDEDEDEDNKEGRRLQALGTVYGGGILGYRPPLVTTVGGCAGTRFGCCNYATGAGVVSANLARIDRFGSNCPGRGLGFLDVCRRSAFGCCSRATGLNIACRNRLCTNDVLYRPRAAAVATATVAGGATVATATAVATPRTVVVPRVVSTPYRAAFVAPPPLVARPRAAAVATATAVAGGRVAGRPFVRNVGGLGGYYGAGGLGGYYV